MVFGVELGEEVEDVDFELLLGGFDLGDDASEFLFLLLLLDLLEDVLLVLEEHRGVAVGGQLGLLLHEGLVPPLAVEHVLLLLLELLHLLQVAVLVLLRVLVHVDDARLVLDPHLRELVPLPRLQLLRLLLLLLVV